MRLVSFVLLLLCVHVNSHAQKLFSGKIIDDNNKPIEEVNILNKTSENHTHSDGMGVFFLEGVSKGDTLQFSRLGFYRKTVVVSDLKKALVVVLDAKTIDLSEVLILPHTNSLNVISDLDIKTSTVNSSQDVLRFVPGIFIGQHAGGGKAEQIFLRGFDIDHGTDINLTVDGLPVNMVSHAHGQGYADLHFVIPETIHKVDFGKGPYYQDKGNFTTAGYVNFETKDQLENSSIKMELGQFNSNRVLGMFNVLNTKTSNAYFATEYMTTDGPFESPQNFKRINVLGKYVGAVNVHDRIELTLSHFSSRWDASGQIPQRAVDDGSITRFGAIDDTEGGTTSRSNFAVNYDKQIDNSSSLKSMIYLSTYDFELYSNFTYFLEDPINGDQIRQKENRTIYGMSSVYQHNFDSNTFDGNFKAGFSLRNDQSRNNELSKTKNRKETLSPVQFGDINETNLGGHIGATINFKKWVFNPSVRFDYFDFQYNDGLSEQFKTLAETKMIISPKLNILYNPTQELQLYAKSGKGFHSNDTRVVVAERGEKILPAAYGFDLGFVWKPTSKMLLNMAYWNLYLEQEFVYVGDAGIVEPSGETQRQGVELSYRYQILPWLFWNFDANYTYARVIEETVGEDYIPLAPDLTMVTSLLIQQESGWFGGINARFIKDRPANEDNSIVAKGYAVADLNMGYKWPKITLGGQIQNLLNSEWNETQFATTSRLKDELEPVEEIHFTPGTPFFVKTYIQYNF